ncbi:MAG: hypothetical protein PHN51_11640 [Candidatus Nanopelagicales bacterium]|nr:hypothetical protein [Candidatus Nanopelagicales bacterium]
MSYQNPHTGYPAPHVQHQQPQQDPRMVAFAQQITQHYLNSGYDMVNGTDGRQYFRNLQSGQLLDCQMAIQNAAIAAQQQQRAVPMAGQYPMQQVGYGHPGPTQMPAYGLPPQAPQTPIGTANPSRYANGSVQNANQRQPETSQHPTEIGGRFGAPQTRATEVAQTSSQPTAVKKETPVATIPASKVWTRRSCRSGIVDEAPCATSVSGAGEQFASVLKRKSAEEGNLAAIAGTSIRSLFAELDAAKAPNIATGLLVNKYTCKNETQREKILAIFDQQTEPKGLYRAMRALFDVGRTSSTPTPVSIHIKAAILGLDRGISEHVNDFLAMIVDGKAGVDSFMDDFNGVLKVLRDNTENAEDDLIDFLKELLEERNSNRVAMTEAKHPALADTNAVYTVDTVSLVQLPLMSTDITTTTGGFTSPEMDTIMCGIFAAAPGRIVYLQTAEQDIYKVYDMSSSKTNKFLVRVYSE